MNFADLSSQTEAALAAESHAAMVARDPILRRYADLPLERIRSVARDRVRLGVAAPPSVVASSPPTPVAEPSKRPPAPAPSVDQQAAALVHRAITAPEPIFSDEECRTLRARLGFDFRHPSQKGADDERAARLDAAMGLAAAPAQGAHYDPETATQSFGAAPRTARSAPLADMDRAMGLAESESSSGVTFDATTGVQTFRAPARAPEANGTKPRLSPAVLAAAAASGDLVKGRNV